MHGLHLTTYLYVVFIVLIMFHSPIKILYSWCNEHVVWHYSERHGHCTVATTVSSCSHN